MKATRVHAAIINTSSCFDVNCYFFLHCANRYIINGLLFLVKHHTVNLLTKSKLRIIFCV